MTLFEFWNQSHISSRFGAVRDGGARKHRGTDYAHGRGTPIPSPLAGVVIGKLSPAPSHGFGYQVTVRADNGIVYSFAHMNSASPLPLGSRVSVGTILGVEGSTGATTGPCVHVEVNDGGFRDPEPYIATLNAGAAATAGLGGRGRITVRGVTWAMVQSRIVSHGFSVGAHGIDGIGGTGTDAGLDAFQRANGLTPDKIVGPLTWAKLNATAPKPIHLPGFGHPTLRKGSTGPAVKMWQHYLRTGFPLYASKLVEDSSFGPATEITTEAWQRRNGLVADGIVGGISWAKSGL